MAETKTDKRHVRLDMTFKVSLQHTVPKDLPTAEAKTQCLSMINAAVKKVTKDLKVSFGPDEAGETFFMDPSAPKEKE